MAAADDAQKEEQAKKKADAAAAQKLTSAEAKHNVDDEARKVARDYY